MLDCWNWAFSKWACLYFTTTYTNVCFVCKVFNAEQGFFHLWEYSSACLTTAESLPQHDITKTRENAKSKTFILISNKLTDVDLSSSMMTLIEECRECNGCLCQVMSVIWMKLGETRVSLWKETLLALNLLQNLFLHGVRNT